VEDINGRRKCTVFREHRHRTPRTADERFPSSRGAGFPRIDGDTRPISESPEHELLEGFGA
jgi:hypothetical protein